MIRSFPLKKDIAAVPALLDRLEALLTERKLPQKTVLRKRLALEELLVRVVTLADNDNIKVYLTALFGEISIRVTYKGAPFDADLPLDGFDSAADDTFFEEELARLLLLRHYQGEITASRHGGVNTVCLKIRSSEQKSLRNTLIALAGGLVIGLALRLGWYDGAQWLSANLFTPFYSMFLNAIKIVAGPLVFFSLSLGIAENGNLRQMGKMVLRLLGLFTVIMLLCLGCGFGVFSLLPVGNPALQSLVTTISAESASVSVLDLLTGIVPSSFLAPFVDCDMLQILFLGILSGIAITGMGSAREALMNGFDTVNRFVARLTTLIMAFTPISIFCAIANLAIGADPSTMVSILGWVGVNYVSVVILAILLGLLILAMTGLSPLRFFRKFRGVLLSAVALDSSSAVMPQNMQVCRDRLGVPPRVYSLSIPLGMTFCSAGTCMSLLLTGLFMARIFSIALTGTTLVMLFLMAFLVSLAAPPVPNALLVAMTILMPAIGVPADAVSLVIGVICLLGPFETMTNVLGVAVGGFITARREGLLDMDAWNR